MDVDPAAVGTDAKPGTRTVGCSLERLVADPTHLERLRDAVGRVHKATTLLTELINLHVRVALDANPAADLSCCFNANWLLSAYNAVTNAKARANSATAPPALAAARALMPAFEPVDRAGIVQCLNYDARGLAATAATNVWMHFEKRVLAHVRRVHALDEAAYKALSKAERKARKLALMQVAADLRRAPDKPRTAPVDWSAWVDAERLRLGIDAAVGAWGVDTPLLYHLKARPHRFLRCMRLMSVEAEAGGRRACSLYPLRRAGVPRHVRFDQLALRQLLRLGASEHAKAQAKKRKRGDEEPAPRVRRKKEDPELVREKAELVLRVVDPRRAGVARRHLFDHAFTTDGVCARVQMRERARPKAAKRPPGAPLASMPRRGVWAIDELKRVARADDLLVVGVDPGKVELVSCVNMDDPRRAPVVRYTQKQRRRDMRSRQYACHGQRNKPKAVREAEAALAGFNSRAPDAAGFAAYCAKRHEGLDASLAFYADLGHRRRRWKAAIKEQQSEQRLYERLEGMRSGSADARPLVLAYGAWGLVAGRPGAAVNRGNPPCIGVGLMRKLARRFVVAPTPEAYTSKTCCACGGACGPWVEREAEMGRKIRGLRRCTQRDCMLPLNRDRNGATNIGANFKRLMGGLPPLRATTDEDLAFLRASVCVECD
jgi:hypothetical protein